MGGLDGTKREGEREDDLIKQISLSLTVCVLNEVILVNSLAVYEVRLVDPSIDSLIFGNTPR